VKPFYHIVFGMKIKIFSGHFEYRASGCFALTRLIWCD